MRKNETRPVSPKRTNQNISVPLSNRIFGRPEKLILLGCHLAMVEWQENLNDPKSYIDRTLAPGRFNQARLVKAERSDNEQPLVLQVGCWAWGQSHNHVKKDYNYENEK